MKSTSTQLENDEVYQIYLKYLQTFDVVKFVQIGAFDGVLYDELHQTISNNEKFKGLLVEPLEKPFQALLETYKHRPDWKFENVAITEKEEIKQIWTIPYELKDSEELPAWATGCSTLMQHSNSLFGKHCTVEEFSTLKKFTSIQFVKCTYLQHVLDKHDFNDFDLFHVDAEGYDWLIIKQLNLEFHKPKVIHFEFFNLSKEHYHEVNSYLKLYGYHLYAFSNNITATLISIQKLSELMPDDVPVTLENTSN
jgi:FkbM family methyltransferase